MTLTTSARRAAPRATTLHGPSFAFAAAVIAGGAALLLLPNPFSLAVGATLLFLATALVALLAWRRPASQSPHYASYWDAAGAILFIGICMAALIQPDQIAALLDGRTAR